MPPLAPIPLLATCGNWELCLKASDVGFGSRKPHSGITPERGADLEYISNKKKSSRNQVIARVIEH